MIKSFRVRFRCRQCKKVFTEYPPFAVPHKRFVKDVILEQAQQYLQCDPDSYRQTVCGDLVPMAYESAEEGRQLSHSTVWRWLSWVGSLKKLFQAGIRMVLEKDPRTDLHRKTYRIASGKYRPGGREKTLQDAARMLELAQRFEELFGTEFFTHFGTAFAGG